MSNSDLKIDAKKETKIIVNFLKKTFNEQKINNAVIGLSGGIDSITSFYLLKKVLSAKNIFVAHLHYNSTDFKNIEKILNACKIPKQNIYLLSIKKSVDELVKSFEKNKEIDKIRKGNIMARVRMIALFDLAKKHNALVCGTENKSENLLGYFTRFGDQASDIEPISHLYKTQIFKLATHLGISEKIINQPPSAGLWKDQTDEGEFGFTYEEADQVLYLSVDKKMSVKEIEKRGFKNVGKILSFREKNFFKHEVPYTVSG
ncbi:MAG TPA: NAD+ synthase [Candidatus Limnocylindrales bacterium]|nr:NAD+ synthase [Candidatus Limnocylindrales bacterium]